MKSKWYNLCVEACKIVYIGGHSVCGAFDVFFAGDD